ncbi:MAG: hypothetical protein RIB59_01010 [Rhodospirillales bacterium]
MFIHRTMKPTIMLGILALAAGTAGTVGAPTLAGAADFSGKKIQLITPYREGGGTDTYARLFAPYLAKHLPGKPVILVKNLPGGGSIKGSNKFEASAKPDGLMFVATSTSTMVSQVFGGDKRKFNMLKWRQIMVSPRGTIIYTSPSTGAKGKDAAADIKAMRGKKLLYGGKKANAGELRTIVAFEVLGLDVQSVFGLSRGNARKAFMRGELNLSHDTAGTYFKKVEKLVKQGKAVPLFTLGFPNGKGKIGRDPAFPNLPHLAEVYEKLNGKKPSGAMWGASKSLFAMGVAASKGFALPKGTPDDVYNAYLKAAKDTLKDKKFQKKAKKMLGNYPQLFGEDAQDAVKEAVDLSPEINKWFKDFLKNKFNVKV